MPDDVDPYKYPWVSSHLVTFRRNILDGVSDENFRDVEGNYFDTAGDQALILPVLYKSKKRLCLPLTTYHYNVELKKLSNECEETTYAHKTADFIRDRGFVHTGVSWEEFVETDVI